MTYIYHGVPANFEGGFLHPLFKLKKKMPHVYEAEIKKYDDHPQRKMLPFKNIPKLNCQRGDVLHCSAIHPSLVFKALKEVFPGGNRSVNFYKIPVSSLRGVNLALFDMNRPAYEFGLKNDPESCFDLIDCKTYDEIKEVPKEAIDFYKEWRNRGERGAPAWGKIPHVFIQGSVRISDLEIMDWRDPLA